jgi:hypothetical protein
MYKQYNQHGWSSESVLLIFPWLDMELKGTVSIDFRTPDFKIKYLPRGNWFTHYNIFGNGDEFVEIFEFQIADDAAESCLLSQRPWVV